MGLRRAVGPPTLPGWCRGRDQRLPRLALPIVPPDALGGLLGWTLWAAGGERLIFSRQPMASALVPMWQRPVTQRDMSHSHQLHLGNGFFSQKVHWEELLELVTPKPWRDVPQQCWHPRLAG